MKLISLGRLTTASKSSLLSLAVVAALSLSGCASVGAPERSGTLAAYEQLRVQPDGTRSWRNPNAEKVSVVRIDPQSINVASDIRIDDEQRKELRQALSEAMSRQFAEAGMRVVATSNTSTDADAITVRVNVTAVEVAAPEVNVVSMLLLFVPVSRGSMSVEMEALTARDGQRFAAMAFSGTAGVNNIGSAFSQIGHAKLQADIAATKFAALVAGTPQK